MAIRVQGFVINNTAPLRVSPNGMRNEIEVIGRDFPPDVELTITASRLDVWDVTVETNSIQPRQFRATFKVAGVVPPGVPTIIKVVAHRPRHANIYLVDVDNY